MCGVGARVAGGLALVAHGVHSVIGVVIATHTLAHIGGSVEEAIV